MSHPSHPALAQHTAVDGDPAFPADAVEVGRVVGAWGLKGGLKVKPFSADPQALFSTKRWFLQAPAPTKSPRPNLPATAPRWPLLLRVIQAREQGDHVVATAQEFDDRDAAEALGGARIFISRASFPTPGDDEFYWVDLIGLAVRNREGLALGQIVGLLETGPTCVLRVQPQAPAVAIGGESGATKEADDGGDAGGTGECLIPFVSAYVDRVDFAGRCVHVDWQPDF